MTGADFEKPVAALPQEARAVLFNSYGEALVYSLDDVVYHSDLDWQPCPVVEGVATEILLDQQERAFVAALWAINTSWRAQLDAIRGDR